MMTSFLSGQTVEFLQGVAGANRKGISARKPVLKLGTIGSGQLPNGGTVAIAVYDKPAGRKASASAKRRKLGATKVALAKGQSKKLSVKLNKRGKSLLRKKGRVKLTVQMLLRDAATGAMAQHSRTLTFKVKKTSKRG